MNCGWPSGVVCTAAMNGTLFSEPRPVLPPERLGVVDLHPAVELTAVLALAHDLHELVLDQPGGLVANAQVAHEFERCDLVLGLGCIGSAAAPRGKRTALATAASRTSKPVRPARFDQRCPALVIAAVPVHEFSHRKSGLKL